MLLHILLSPSGIPFIPMALPPLNILQDSVCSPLMERLSLLVLVTWPSSVFSVTPVLTSAAALTLSFKCLHTCYTKDYKLLEGREWVIFISCLAQRLKLQCQMDGMEGWIFKNLLTPSNRKCEWNLRRVKRCTWIPKRFIVREVPEIGIEVVTKNYWTFSRFTLAGKMWTITQWNSRNAE